MTVRTEIITGMTDIITEMTRITRINELSN